MICDRIKANRPMKTLGQIPTSWNFGAIYVKYQPHLEVSRARRCSRYGIGHFHENFSIKILNLPQIQGREWL